MAVTAETLGILERVRSELTGMTDAQTLALTRAWVEAWDVLLPELEAAFAALLNDSTAGKVVPYATVRRNEVLRAALETSRELLKELAGQVEGVVLPYLDPAVLAGVDSTLDLLRSQLPAGASGAALNFSRPAEAALAEIVRRTTEQIHSTAWPLAAEHQRVMRRALVRGIAVGDNPRATAARILRETEKKFNGGLTRALNIARTETLDAHRAAAQAAHKAATEVSTEWEWSAKLDARTCPSCWAKHGTRYPVDQFGPEDHQSGRCARLPVTKSWKDLGFDIEEPPSLMPDARAVFDSLTPESQAAILGPGRLKLLQDGGIDWADLSTKRTTDGWRDSYGVKPLRDLTSSKEG